MVKPLLSRIERFLEFSPADADNVRALREAALPLIPAVVDRFYTELLQDEEARATFTGGERQLARQRLMFAEWLRDVFDCSVDIGYQESRMRIGQAHADVGLPQRFMLLGMETVRRELTRLLAETGKADEAKLNSLQKLLTLDLTLMLESYKDHYSQRIKAAERGALRAKLMRAEHLAEVGQLAASLAHEIKNPLAGISGAIQVIRDSLETDDPHRRIIEEILGQISRMDATVKDLLLYARPTPPSPSETPVGKIVARVLSLLAKEPSLRHVTVEVDDAKDEGATVFADSQQLEQLLINLILNAAHASRKGGRITVSIDGSAVRTVLKVRDYGSGMPPETLARALEPFFTTKARGTGLGLAICRRICESNGGNISLESRESLGTTVVVDFPRDGGPRTET